MDDPRNPYDVQVGQVWLNRNARAKGQIIKVVALEFDGKVPMARCTHVTDQRSWSEKQIHRHVRTVWLSSFRDWHKGYRRLK